MAFGEELLGVLVLADPSKVDIDIQLPALSGNETKGRG